MNLLYRILADSLLLEKQKDEKFNLDLLIIKTSENLMIKERRRHLFYSMSCDCLHCIKKQDNWINKAKF